MYYLAEVIVDAIELRSSVFEVAKEYFSLPDVGPRFKIHQTSVLDYLEKSRNTTESFDLIIVDLFITTNEKDISVDISENYSLLYKMLQNQGCLCINLLGCDYRKYPGLDYLISVFNYCVYAIRVDASNTILFATKQSVPDIETIIDFSEIEKRYGLPFSQNFNKMESV
ncbi:MAG: hypothetical protein OQL06_12680 [Gammaproteobacteria bacterium]|nr:hypothetical protein [Gammaproteobacteria bacterium]